MTAHTTARPASTRPAGAQFAAPRTLVAPSWRPALAAFASLALAAAVTTGCGDEDPGMTSGTHTFDPAGQTGTGEVEPGTPNQPTVVNPPQENPDVPVDTIEDPVEELPPVEEPGEDEGSVQPEPADDVEPEPEVAEPEVPEPSYVVPRGGWTALAAGSLHACGIHEGALYCWGNNSNGQVGQPASDPVLVPTLVPAPADGLGDAAWTTVHTGLNHSCATRGDALYCWGQNQHGQVGDGTDIERHAPVLVPAPAGTSGWQSLAVGGSHNCAIADGAVYCWGGNAFRQLGDGNWQPRANPAPVLDPVGFEGSAEPWTYLVAGSYHTCGLRADELFCWGYNINGQIGDGGFSSRDRPTRVAIPEATIVQSKSGGAEPDVVETVPNGWDLIAAGGHHTCAQRVDGTWCWGQNSDGQLGVGAGPRSTVPVHQDNGLVWDSLTAGFQQTCGTTGGDLYCWGRNLDGRLGDGTTTGRNLPGRVEATAFTEERLQHAALGEDATPLWETADAGDYYTCGLWHGHLLCTGFNGLGSLGNGTLDGQLLFDTVVVPTTPELLSQR